MMSKGKAEFTIAVSPRAMSSSSLGFLRSTTRTGRTIVVQPVATLAGLAQQLEAAGLGPTLGDLDSIEDSLGSLDMYESAGRGHLLAFEDLAQLADSDPSGFDSLLRILSDAQISFQEESPETLLSVVVCLRGWSSSRARRSVEKIFVEAPPPELRVISIDELLATASGDPRPT
jgi:hypothetical protein